MNRKLKTIRKKNAGRSYGKVVVRHQGGEHKRFLRNIDFKRNKVGAVGRVVSLEYDPNRTVKIALVHYADGEKRYIIAPLDLNVGDSVSAGKDVDIRVGNTLPLSSIP